MSEQQPMFKIVLFLFVLVKGLNAQSTQGLWFTTDEQQIRSEGKRQIVPGKYLTYTLNTASLLDILGRAVPEQQEDIKRGNATITLPTPDGGFQNFRLFETVVLADALKAQFPEFKAYNIKGIDDPYASGKLDWNAFGFHAMVRSLKGDFFIDPYDNLSKTDYIVYYTKDFIKDPAHRSVESSFYKELEKQSESRVAGPASMSVQAWGQSAVVCVGSQLKTYRLAVACTGEYAIAATGLPAPTVSQVLSKIMTSINRVNGVYETEVAVRLTLVPTETLIIFTNPSTDPFTGNFNPNVLINESHTVITNNIGTANFDIGHTFSSANDGLAQLACVCLNVDKGRAVSGSSNPAGDPFDIDLIAHEIGHQFNARHTFNANTSGCNLYRYAPTAVEPGGGVTIMTYAGLCGVNDIVANDIPYFHTISYDAIVNYITTQTGSTCPVSSNTGNQAPTVTGSGNRIIPKSTAFFLQGAGVDPNGDSLSFSWEEIDVGVNAGNWNSGLAPYFRSYPPQIFSRRYFPATSVVLSGNYTGVKGEFVPPTPQTLNFRLTARDNKTGGGGVCYTANSITVTNAGPFTVTQPDNTGIVWSAGTQTVTWDVNGTNAAPVNCASVSIHISYNSGSSFSTLVNSVPNTGSATVTIPTFTSTINTCRIKVESIGNIFYDIGNNDFSISGVSPPPPPPDTSGTNLKNHNSDGLVLNISPNPFNESPIISLKGINAASETLLMVVNLLGQNVYKVVFKSAEEIEFEVDLSNVAEGIYCLSIIHGQTQLARKLVKSEQR